MGGKLVFDCSFDAGPAGSGNLDPAAVEMLVQPSIEDQSLDSFYPWKSLNANGLQPLVAVEISIVLNEATKTVKKDTETHVKCLPYYYSNGEKTQVEDSSAAKFQVIYQGKVEGE